MSRHGKDSGDAVQRAPRTESLGARFTAAAREHIEHYLHSFVSFEPVGGLLYSTANGEGSWSVAAFGQATVDELVEMYGRFGAVVYYDIDGILLVIPQLAHIEQLDSGVLDIADGRIVRRTEPDHG
jgi:hypothetical protein